MPQAAIKALEGKLAEGIDPMSVVEALQEAGWKPPADDPSYTEGEGTPVEGAGAPDEPMESPEAGVAIAIGLEEEEPKNMNDRRASAAKKAMKKHGWKEE